MADREKLIKLMNKVQDYGTKNTYEERSVTIESKNNETIADYLIANGATFHKWIPVSERLPEVDELVIAFCKIGKIFVGYRRKYYSGRWGWAILTARDSTKGITQTVTHWMPLPEPPKEDYHGKT